VQDPTNSQNLNRYSYCLNNPLKYTDPSGKLFKEIFGTLGAVINILPFVVDVFLDGPIRAWKNYKSDVRSWWDAGKSIDNIIFGNKNNTGPLVTAQPGFRGSFNIIINGQTYTYYVFDNLKGAVNFMWEESERSKKEIACYVLEDKEGKRYYYIFDWQNNTDDYSINPEVMENPKKKGTYTFDNKVLIAQIHTHPSSLYERSGNPNGYDGPSYKDYKFSYERNVPVYTIGPHSVSVISAKGKTLTEDYFKTLSFNSYRNFLGVDRSVNPFAILPRSVWLESPFIYEIVLKKK